MDEDSCKFSEIDDTDKLILAALQRNAKVTIKQLAGITGLSPTAVRARLKRLESTFIKKYTALLDCTKMGYHEMVIAHLRINSSLPLSRIKEEVQGMTEVRFSYITTGDYPIIILAKCLDHGDSISFLEQLRNIEGVEEVTTQMVLDRIKEDPDVIIPGINQKYVDNLLNEKLGEA
ncbi:MAG: Lrp/AsnC family transcriptional regulator [Promethearchaeota archaeon]